jgi:hypothetical protein
MLKNDRASLKLPPSLKLWRTSRRTGNPGHLKDPPSLKLRRDKQLRLENDPPPSFFQHKQGGQASGAGCRKTGTLRRKDQRFDWIEIFQGYLPKRSFNID